MTFDDRWKSLAAAARRAPEPPSVMADAVSDFSALVHRGMAARSASVAVSDISSDWRGMAMAAGLCAACLAGLMSIAPVRDEVGDAFVSLAQAPRSMPTTAFIPAPPQLPALASLSPVSLSPADLADRVAGWFTASPETTP